MMSVQELALLTAIEDRLAQIERRLTMMEHLIVGYGPRWTSTEDVHRGRNFAKGTWDDSL